MTVCIYRHFLVCTRLQCAHTDTSRFVWDYKVHIPKHLRLYEVKECTDWHFFVCMRRLLGTDTSWFVWGERMHIPTLNGLQKVKEYIDRYFFVCMRWKHTLTDTSGFVWGYSVHLMTILELHQLTVCTHQHFWVCMRWVCTHWHFWVCVRWVCTHWHFWVCMRWVSVHSPTLLGLYEVSECALTNTSGFVWGEWVCTYRHFWGRMRWHMSANLHRAARRLRELPFFLISLYSSTCSRPKFVSRSVLKVHKFKKLKIKNMKFSLFNGNIKTISSTNPLVPA